MNDTDYKNKIKSLTDSIELVEAPPMPLQPTEVLQNQMDPSSTHSATDSHAAMPLNVEGEKANHIDGIEKENQIKKRNLLILLTVVAVLIGAFAVRLMKSPSTISKAPQLTKTAPPTNDPPVASDGLPPLPGGTEIYVSDDPASRLKSDEVEIDLVRKSEYLPASQRSCSNQTLSEYDQAVCLLVGEAKYFDCAPDGKRFATSHQCTPPLPSAKKLAGAADSDIVWLDPIAKDLLMDREDSVAASTANRLLVNQSLSLTNQATNNDTNMSGITVKTLAPIAPNWWLNGPALIPTMNKNDKLNEIHTMVQARKRDIQNAKLFAVSLPVSVRALIAAQNENETGGYELLIDDLIQQLNGDFSKSDFSIDSDGALNIRMSTKIVDPFFYPRPYSENYFIKVLNPNLRGGAIPAGVTVSSPNKFKTTDRLSLALVFERVGVPTKIEEFDGVSNLVIQNVLAKYAYLVDLVSGEVIDGGPKFGMKIDSISDVENASRILSLGAANCSKIRAPNHVATGILEECDARGDKLRTIAKEKDEALLIQNRNRKVPK